MGVPKFFAWLSERYPCIISTIDEAHVPEYDYLYLDMNGVIHTCTHPDDNTVETKMTEEEMAIACFKYVDKLFHLIRPRKMLFMAVDGVAPRAKMNQQRARRFVSARDAARSIKRSKEHGDDAEKMYFDSNCITPGTHFMTKLSEGLKFFVQKKIKEDPFWRRVEVTLSGHEVPGEGEHKIMDFIRSLRADPKHDPNTRHCLYGLDADLILLGLATHEPHFSLLREHVVFGRRVTGGKHRPRKGTPQEMEHHDPSDDFRLLHLSILRSYLQLEFSLPQMKQGKDVKFDIERVLDDFNVLCYFIGNDFLPHLPFRDIARGSLNALLELYTEMLPKMDGYICSDEGEIVWERLASFVEMIQSDEDQLLTDRYADDDDEPGYSMVSKHRGRKQPYVKPVEIGPDEAWPVTKGSEGVRLPEEDLDGEEIILTPQLLNPSTFINTFEKLAVDDEIEADVEVDDIMEEEEESEESEEEEEEGDHHEVDDGVHMTYYRDKWGDAVDEEGFLDGLCRDYVEGLAWVYQYYFRGVPSWMWFYPHHYAPLARDLSAYILKACTSNQHPREIKFELSTPFLPFQQLLGVLPPFSGHFLPKAYERLMTAPDSPILDFYPDKFDTDLNGKRQDWEAVVLISFIDEKRLLEASSNADLFLTNEEKHRNSHGEATVFHYTRDSTIEHVPSPLPSHLPSLDHVPVARVPLTVCKPDVLRPVLLPGCRVGRDAPPGFPTLSTLPHSAYLKIPSQEGKRRGPAKRPVLTVMVHRELEEAQKAGAIAVEMAGDAMAQSLEHAAALIGHSILADWPYLKEGRVVGVLDEQHRISVDTAGQAVSHSKTAWDKAVQTMKMGMEIKRGIDVGAVSVIVEVVLCEGVSEFDDGTVRKIYGDEKHLYPLHHTLTVDMAEHLAGSGPHREDRRIERLRPPSMKEQLAIGTSVVYLGLPPYAGAVGTVSSHSEQSGGGLKLSISISTPTPPIPDRLPPHSHRSRESDFYPSYECAKMLNIHPLALAKVTSHIRIEGDKRLVGLGIKFDQRNQAAFGLARRVLTLKGRMIWEFHKTALAMIAAYRQAFPQFFLVLERMCHGPNPSVNITGRDLGIDRSTELAKVVGEMLTFQQDVLHLDRLVLVPTDAEFLSKDECMELAGALDTTVHVVTARFKASLKKNASNITLEHIQPSTAIIMSTTPGCAGVPKKYRLPASEFRMYDRCVVGCAGGGFGSGTGFLPCGSYCVVAGISKDRIDVIFDTVVLGATDLHGRCPPRRGASVLASSLVNLSVFGAKTRKTPSIVPQSMPNPWHASRGGHAVRGRGRGRGGVSILQRDQPPPTATPPTTSLPMPPPTTSMPIPTSNWFNPGHAQPASRVQRGRGRGRGAPHKR